MTLWLIVPTGVYDHGTGGIFDTLEAATAHADALMAASDGYHDLEIREMPLNTPLDPGVLGDPRRRRDYGTSVEVVRL